MKSSVLLNFVLQKRNIQRLSDALKLPRKIVYCQGTVAHNIEALCILLKILSYPCRLSDMVPLFGRNPAEICLIFNYVLDYIYNRFNYHVVHQKGSPLQNCLGLLMEQLYEFLVQR